MLCSCFALPSGAATVEWGGRSAPGGECGARWRPDCQCALVLASIQTHTLGNFTFSSREHLYSTTHFFCNSSRLTTLSAELQSSSSASTKSCFKSARPPCRRSLGRQIDSRRPPEQGPPETREMLANRVALTCLPTDRSATRLRFRSDDPSLPHAPVARLRSCSDQVRPVHGWLLEAKVLGLGGIRRR